jgi:hypothetical protein
LSVAKLLSAWTGRPAAFRRLSSATFSSIGPVEGLDPPLVEEPQFDGEFGKGLGARLDRGGEVGRGVGMGDEIHRQRGREEALHPRLVVERLAVEVAPIPAQKHIADVEDDDQGSVLKFTGSNAAG